MSLPTTKSLSQTAHKSPANVEFPGFLLVWSIPVNLSKPHQIQLLVYGLIATLTLGVTNYSNLIEAAKQIQKTVTLTHVKNVLVQTHWRSHEESIKQQALSRKGA
ncbi:hypothetical protein [Microbulbifer spongiae]|uniref:Uncharacterized protein n=1 Tax=Microbulbifer spongiae TaxID=2944933 RepID=A0ABY9E996_9GAMM|nr:hypothetical protein [Microbulbifer sp. MI-G]WKD48902.1 hypothetical protein M8T91_13495 [Microbulbifer sp. MI-G]